MQANTYLHFNGRCREAFEFYAQCLGGKIESLMTWADMPQPNQVPPELHARVMHASLTVGDWALMGSDAPPEHYRPPQGFAVTLTIPAMEEARRVFDALAEGGTVQMAFEPTFFAQGFGTLQDRFGIPWMVVCPQPE